MKEDGVDMFGQNSQLFRLGVGGLGDFDFGPGIAGYKSWIVAFVILLVLALLAWWTMRPGRRAARNRRTAGPQETTSAQPATEHAGDDVTRTKQTRKA